MGDMGRLIISTKSMAVGRKIYLLIVGIFMILLGLFALVNEDMSDAFGRGDTAKLCYYAVCVGIFIGGISMLVLSFMGFKSYCDVYEGGVVGTSGVSANKNAAPQQNFRLTYSDIVNVAESGKTIFIYTNFGNFEVLALKNRVEATLEIRKRMMGGRMGEPVRRMEEPVRRMEEPVRRMEEPVRRMEEPVRRVEEPSRGGGNPWRMPGDL